MDELVSQLTSKVGLSADQAKQSVATVLEFLKGKLGAAAAPVESLLSGGAASAESLAGGAASKLGGMFGS